MGSTARARRRHSCPRQQDPGPRSPEQACAVGGHGRDERVVLSVGLGDGVEDVLLVGRFVIGLAEVVAGLIVGVGAGVRRALRGGWTRRCRRGWCRSGSCARAAGPGERARKTLRCGSSLSSPPGAWDAERMQPILSMLRPRSLSSDVLSRVLVRVSESDERPPIIDENDLPQAEPPFLPLLGDLAAPGSWELVRSRALTRSWDAWAPRVCGDTFGEEVSKDHERRGVLGQEVGVCASEVLLRERGEKSGMVGVGEAMVDVRNAALEQCAASVERSCC